jgi:hypothetical protein
MGDRKIADAEGRELLWTMRIVLLHFHHFIFSGLRQNSWVRMGYGERISMSARLGFVALVPIPKGRQTRRNAGHSRRFLRSWPLGRRSGCVPAEPYPPPSPPLVYPMLNLATRSEYMKLHAETAENTGKVSRSHAFSPTNSAEEAEKKTPVGVEPTKSCSAGNRRTVWLQRHVLWVRHGAHGGGSRQSGLSSNFFALRDD